jgi:excisionase family DNA binding protein
MTDPTALTTPEAARRLGLQPITVQRWLRRGLLAGVKLPGRAGWRIDPSSVERLLGGPARSTHQERTAS